ncbi:uncharacterized protein KD926_005671 [Aspergillus affinis]|uniref:uncharacterized protein n=1 Tax=Aspergillus affinis TaxID=1070780 RepID=UPI0022FF2D80|nr:uncharacterized protein KD926_005671 [Aspergillus affinis]KAI9042375.1 hypothetical protein KD926_005671 [Aspergillus affinis]
MMDAGLTQVYGTLSNHEMSPTNAFMPSEVNNSTMWLFGMISKAWSRWVGPSTDITNFGRYSVKHPSSNLRIISLNTNLYYTLEFCIYELMDSPDPNHQLQWLTNKLDSAERSGERVYIIGHMPMGSPDAFRDASNRFDQIVNRYEATIAAMIFGIEIYLCPGIPRGPKLNSTGHTYLDHFEISYSNYQNQAAETAVSVSYIAPSISPLPGMPAFRVNTVDPVTFGILDVETYIADMDQAEFQTKPVWTKSYSAKQSYGSLIRPSLNHRPITELTPAFWHNVTTILETDSATFNTYWSRRTRG